MNFPPMHKPDPSRANATVDEMTQGFNGISWIRSLNNAPGMDSVLNQSLPMQASQQRFYLHNGAYVPTVLPATLQPCVGPTASAGTGPYGPYWPDGAYIPYRPAAFREPRLNTQAPYQYFDAGHQPFNTGATYPELGDWTQNTSGIFNQEGPLKTNFPPRHSDQKPFDSSNNQRVLPLHTRNSSSNGTGFASRPPAPGHHSSWSGPSDNNGFQTQNGCSSRVNNAEFKEKVLSWAHGVYVDLLASIHRARRNSASNATQNGQNRLVKPSIYPKPPRQPGLDFSNTNPPEVIRHNSYPSGQYDFLPVVYEGTMNVNMHSNDRYERHSMPQFQQIPPSNHFVERLRHTGRLNSISGSFSNSPANENTTLVNAASSLELLSHLCMESGWEWIDGMLLGGCLAYGLGDYNKAMRWYSRIIARDAS
jgi:hypothetical protein